MKSSILRMIAVAVLVAAAASIGVSADIVSSGLKGVWSSDTTWIGGIVPGPGDNVTIANGDTVTFDMDSTEVANLTIGQGDSASFRTSAFKITKLTVTGNILINPLAEFRVNTRDVSAPTHVVHTLVMYGNITSNGALDFRRGSAGSTLAVMNIEWVGSSNSTVSTPGYYTKDTHEFNGMTIRKDGGANLLLGSDVHCAGGSSTEPQCDPIVTFVRGKVITGDYAFIHFGTTQAFITGMTDSTYFVGALGRGLSNSSGNSKTFPVGDEFGYRPIKVGAATPGVNTGHHVIVRVTHANANTGTSTLVGGIDKVSEMRYYAITYRTRIASTNPPAPTMDVAIFGPNYGLDDGIRAGNTNLRVAYSIDDRATWTKIDMAAEHSTNLNSLPRQINPDSVRPYIHLDTLSTVAYIALADSGGFNPLDGTYSGFGWDPKELAFGSILPGSTKEDSITIFNTGTGDLTIRSSSRTDSVNFGYNPSAPYTIPVGGQVTLHVTFHPDSAGFKSGYIIFYHDAPDNPDSLYLTGNAITTTTLDIPVNPRWNMISNPVDALNDSTVALFPTATSTAFRYQPGVGYQSSARLLPGSGYWLKFADAEIVPVTGGARPVDTISVAAGWNLVGSVSSSLLASQVVAVGTSIQSVFYKYNQGYVRADTIKPGEAYWVKVDQVGDLILDTSAPIQFSGMPGPSFESMNRLMIRDAEGNEQELYFGTDATATGKISSHVTELPPAPPTGVFDARFSSNRLLETAIGNHGLNISSAIYPVTVSWSMNGQAASSIIVNGAETLMEKTGSVRIEQPSATVALALKSTDAVPSVYALLQNYPNPFNPTTTIGFDLPFVSVVTLKVYNVLGQEVASLFERRLMSAGEQTVSFDAGALPSGAYLYRLSAEKIAGKENATGDKLFTSVRRMLVVK